MDASLSRRAGAPTPDLGFVVECRWLWHPNYATRGWGGPNGDIVAGAVLAAPRSGRSNQAVGAAAGTSMIRSEPITASTDPADAAETSSRSASSAAGGTHSSSVATAP